PHTPHTSPTRRSSDLQEKPMQEYQKAFIEFVIRHDILRFGSFTLKSGRTSPYFFNAGLFNTGKALAFIGNSYAAALAESGLDYEDRKSTRLNSSHVKI